VYGQITGVNLWQLGAPAPKFTTFKPLGTATGSVSGNTVTISVPLAAVGLKSNDKLDNVTAWTFSEKGPLPSVIDEAKAFSYVIGTPAAAQHAPDGYVQVSVDDPTFANPVTAALTGSNGWSASLGSLSTGTHIVYVRQVLSSALYNPGSWDDVVAGPVTSQTITFS
jgi:uncharacterized protein (DUF736 family)